MGYIRRTVACRCWKCWKRRTLDKRPDDYIRAPKCFKCGSKGTLFICKDRLPSRWGRKHLCNCSGYWFNHRKGSKFCDFNPNVEKWQRERAENYAR